MQCLARASDMDYPTTQEVISNPTIDSLQVFISMQDCWEIFKLTDKFKDLTFNMILFSDH